MSEQRLEVIQVKQLREFPVCAVWCLTAKTVEEVKTWAQKKGARQVWYYEHQIGNLGITAVVRASEVIQ